jgi:hypothetical protein
MSRVSVHALVLVSLLGAAGCSAPVDPPPDGAAEPAPPLPEHLADIRRPLLDLHNRERALVKAPPLKWDPALAVSAASYGPTLAGLGKLEHAPLRQRPGQGENLWMGTRNAYPVERMFRGWAAEKSIFRRGTFPDVSTTARWQDVAHYTQVIWRGTTRVGCAVHQAEKWDYLICRYAPPGNVRGRPVP